MQIHARAVNYYMQYLPIPVTTYPSRPPLGQRQPPVLATIPLHFGASTKVFYLANKTDIANSQTIIHLIIHVIAN